MANLFDRNRYSSNWFTDAGYGSNKLTTQTGRGEQLPTKAGVHSYWSPDRVRKQLNRGGTSGGRKNPLTGEFEVSDQAVFDEWEKRNTHSDRYRNDPEYRAEWDATHGQGSTLGQLFQAGVGAMVLGGVGGEIAGALSGSGSAAAAGSGAPAGGMAGSTGAGTATAAATGGGMDWGNIFNPSGSTPGLLETGLNWALSSAAANDSRDAIQAGFEQQNPFAAEQPFYIDQLRSLYEDPSRIKDTPGYRFALEQGNEALLARQAASGNRFSGRALEEAQKFGQGLASQMWNQEVSRLGAFATGTNAGGVATGQNMSSLSQQDAYNTGYFLNNIFRNINTGSSTPAPTITNTGYDNSWLDPFGEDSVN